MLNTKIKSFNSIAYFNNIFFNINEKTLKNKWSILFFFPFSYTFICPTELKDISNRINEFKKNNIQIFAVSTDSHFTHKNWIKNELNFINFPFISDFNHNISNNLKILNKKDGNSNRCTIIVDPNLIIKSFDLLDLSISRSVEDILNRCRMLIFTNLNKNKVCPYIWNKNNNSISII